MPGYLHDALMTVDWNAHVSTFLEGIPHVERLEKCNRRLAVWSKQLESADKGNPALCFVREMQAASHVVPALTSLALYKQSAAAMRTIVETALYYSYFRSHLVELSTLVREASYYVRKSDVMNYHTRHTVGFAARFVGTNLNSRLEDWYSRASAIIHGQVPGKWTVHSGLAQIGHDSATIEEVVKMFEECEEVVHLFFLCTVGQILWDDFSGMARSALLRGVPGNIRTQVALSTV